MSSLRSVLFCLGLAIAALAQTLPRVQGKVVDAQGRPVPAATVVATDAHGAPVASSHTDAQGRFTLAPPASARAVTASTAGLASPTQTLSTAGSTLVLTLAPRAQSTEVSVTALGLALPTTQIGNATSTISRQDLAALDGLQAAAALRLEPGLGVIQSGPTGGEVSVFLRGAPSNFTKVLLDGVPIQRLDLGGYDFSNLVPAGLETIEVLRGPDSVIYGSDAAAGVISLETRRGDEVQHPEFDSTTQAGAYSTFVQDNQLLGAWRAFDYAFRFGYLDTRNQQPGAKFRNNTYGANIGWKVRPHSVLRLSLQRSYSDTGQPNAELFYGLSEGSFKHQGETYGGLSFQTQTTRNWRQRFEASESLANLFSEVPGPVGIPDGFGDFDGLPVTIHGANGTQAAGQAILGFGGAFPQISPSDTLRRDLGWENELQLAPQWSLLGGYRYYDERGLSSNVALSRHDNGGYGVLAGALGSRFYGNGGASVDRNTPFGTTANPQGSLVWYPRLGTGVVGPTRLRLSAGTALKDPELEDEEFSLYQELFTAPDGPALIHSLGLSPVRPQRARNFDAGVDQYFGAGTELSLTVFDNRYYDLIEFIPTTAFPALGIPAAVAQSVPFGGEFNSLTERSAGVEAEAVWRPSPAWRLRANYTATAAKILRSFSSDALAPAISPNFPNTLIGAFAPLVGQRPFRVPPRTATLDALYSHGRWVADANLNAVSRRDDSTFLTDANFGNTLLLPNRNLDPAYFLVNMAATYRLRPGLSLLAAVYNVFNRSYQEVIGYPGPGITGRVGVRLVWPSK